MADEAPGIAKGMTLENLNAAFQVFGIFMLLALCAFMKEKRVFELVGHHFLKMVKTVPTVLNRAAGSFAKLLNHRGTIINVQPEVT